MRFHSANQNFETKKQFQTVDLTPFLIGEIRRSGVRNGFAIIYTGHTTGAIVLNELDPWLNDDIKSLLSKLVPYDDDYKHPRNAQSHLVGFLLSQSQVIPIREGEPALGTWQSVYWVEAERRPRSRNVDIIVIGE